MNCDLTSVKEFYNIFYSLKLTNEEDLTNDILITINNKIYNDRIKQINQRYKTREEINNNIDKLKKNLEKLNNDVNFLFK